MNRIIIFRAWDKNYNCMYDWSELSLEEGGIRVSDGVLWDGYDQIELMQFTGLYDKNGKEIFEGDIVKYYDSTTMWLTSQVKEVGGAFAVLTDENPILLYDFQDEYEYNGEPIPKIEIIGNIYQNSELLNTNKD